MKPSQKTRDELASLPAVLLDIRIPPHVNPDDYSALRAWFGNATDLHLRHRGDGGVDTVEHAPNQACGVVVDLDGRDLTLEIHAREWLNAAPKGFLVNEAQAPRWDDLLALARAATPGEALPADAGCPRGSRKKAAPKPPAKVAPAAAAEKPAAKQRPAGGA